MYIEIAWRSLEIERQIAKDHNSLDTEKEMVSSKNRRSLNECIILPRWNVGGAL